MEYDKWDSMIDSKSKHKKIKNRKNEWCNKSEIHNAFQNLFNKFQNSILIISYRDDGIPTTQELVEILKKLGKQVEIKKAYILNNLDYNYQVVRVSEDFDYTIIFCENGRHFSVAKNNVMNLKPNVFIDLRESIIGNDEVGLLYKFNQICFYNTPSNKVSTTTKLHYVFFDLETIVDWDYANCMKPYS